MAEARRLAAEKRGRRSETLAALLLRLKGYRILGRRVRTHAGEIDLIASDALGPRQRARIAHAAELFLASRPGLAAKGARFDVVTVSPGAFPRHIRDAWRPGN
jgi:putative endonuclease